MGQQHLVGPGRPLRLALGAWLTRVAPASARGVVNIAVVSDSKVRALNRQYRGRDYATDVLSFPAGDAVAGPAKAGRHVRSARSLSWGSALAGPAGARHLGDIVIARGVAQPTYQPPGRPASQYSAK